MLGQNKAFAAQQQHCALHDVFKLADVVRPGVALQHIHNRKGEAHVVAPVCQRVFFDKVVCQRQNILWSETQGRQENGEDIEAVEQIAAEGFFLHHFFQVTVGGGDKTHIHIMRFHAAKAFKGPFLQHAQQFCLGHERKLTHFVQKQRAAVGKLKASLARSVCAGEGPAFMAEQLAFNEGFWQCGAVERNKGLVGARAARMDGACCQFFARAGFAL